VTITNGGVVNSFGFTGIGEGSTLNLGDGGLAGAIVTPAIDNRGRIVANFTDTLTLAAAVFGAGRLSKAGPGTLILTGSNTYTGGTTITGGTLQLGDGGTSGSIVGNITNDGTFAINRSDTFTFGGVISGTGAFAQVGLGTTILTAANTYSGGTVINNGVLAVAADANLGAATGGLSFGGGTLQFLSGFTSNRAVTLNTGGGTVDTNGNSATLGGSISGSGAFTKIGGGPLTLSGTSSYSGATAVNAGTLQAGAVNTFAPGSAFTVASGATLNLASFNQTIGSLAGAGSVALGSATLTSGTDNTSTTFSGTISGTGGLTKIGSGTLTLSGANSYSGGTTLAAGTLSLANNQALGSGPLTTTGSVVDYANGVTIANPIVLNSNTTQLQVATGTATQAGVISELNGPRPLEKIGGGTLVLTANNTYSGPTTVSAGTLIVNGSIANSAVTVDPGATLAGTGAVGAITITSGGTFAPGAAGTTGAMTVAGNLAFQSGALYLVQVNPSTASSTTVTAGGTAALGGTVQAVFASGRYAARNYTILSAAGGLSGAFSSLSTSNLPAGFTASLGYTATNVVLNLTATLGRRPSDLGTTGLSINQTNVAEALNNFFNNGGTLPPEFVSIFGLSGASLANALTLLSGEAATGAQQGAFQLGNQFLGIMLDPFVDGRSGVVGAAGPALGFAPEREDLPDDIALAYSKVLKAPPKPATFEQRWSVWGAGYGGSNRTSGDPAVVGSHDLSARTAGGAAGLDYRLAPGTVIGFALAGGGTNWSLAQGLGGGRSDAFQAGVYGATRYGPAYLAAAFAYTNHWMSTDRFAFAGDHLTASFNAQSLGGRVEGGYRFMTVYGGLTPYAAIQAQSFRTPSYSESDLTGGGFALAYNARTATDTRSELGARFDRLLLLNPNAAVTMRARVAWAHDWISDPTLAAVFQTLPGASFIVNGATPAKNSALTSAGAELRLANGVTLIGKFDGEFASRSSTYAGTGTVRYSW
jgi:autotransporter-associated beta strand protein